MIVVVSADAVGQWANSAAEVVVICDPDPELAAKASRGMVGTRSAVFVGDIRQERERLSALDFVCETFNVASEEVLIALPS